MAFTHADYAIEDLILDPARVEAITADAVEFAKSFLRAFGQAVPVFVNSSNLVVFNTVVVLAALELGWATLTTAQTDDDVDLVANGTTVNELLNVPGKLRSLLPLAYPVGTAGGDLTGKYPDPDLAAAPASPGVVPVGGIIMYSGAFVDIPAEFALCDGTGGTPDLTDKFIKGTNTEGDVGVTGGAATHTPAGTVAAPSFTGAPLGTHSHSADGTLATDSVSAGTPAGSVSAPVFTGNALAAHHHTADGTLAAASSSAGTPAGTNSAPAFTGTPLGTHAHSADGTLATDSVSAGTPAGSVAAPVFTGNALATHNHGGATGTPSATQASSFLLSTGPSETHTHSISAQSAGTPSGTNTAPAFAGSALGGHSHDVTGNTSDDSAGTPAGTVAAPVFTGSALSGHTHDVTGNTSDDSAGTPSGSNSVPTFAGSALAGHTHDVTGNTSDDSAGTPAGTNTAPAFTGASADYQPAFYKLAYIMRML